MTTTATATTTKPQRSCQHCGYTWTPRRPVSKACPECKTRWPVASPDP